MSVAPEIQRTLQSFVIGRGKVSDDPTILIISFVLILTNPETGSMHSPWTSGCLLSSQACPPH